MKKFAIIFTLMTVFAVVAWNYRHDVRSRLSDARWETRAQFKGSGNTAGSVKMHVERYEVDSKILDRKLEQVAFIPAGQTKNRPLLIFLHGRGGHPGAFRKQFSNAFRQFGAEAPIVVQVSGGDHSYYHDREDGSWGRYVVNEAIPAAVNRFDLDNNKLAIGGWSMGGFGAYDIARTHPGMFCAIGGHSAAMWTDAGSTPSGAFDNAQDFEQHDIIGDATTNPDAYAGSKLWLDGGDTDPFRAANTEFAQALTNGQQDLVTHTWPGDHSRTYWKAHIDEYLSFYSDALSSCKKSR